MVRLLNRSRIVAMVTPEVWTEARALARLGEFPGSATRSRRKHLDTLQQLRRSRERGTQASIAPIYKHWKELLRAADREKIAPRYNTSHKSGIAHCLLNTSTKTCRSRG